MAKKGSTQVSGFAGRTIGAMIQKSTGASAKVPSAPAGKKKGKK